MKEVAENYIYEGLAALPLNDNKSPKLPTEHPYLYELIPESKIESLFIGAAKIGIACGTVSKGFECIDFDGHKGEPIQKIFNEFMADVGTSTIVKTNNLPIVKTPSGGLHIYYKCEAENKGRAWAKWENGTVMIETRGHGQYVATVPSKGYEQLKGVELINTPIITEDERDFLLFKAESLSLAPINTTSSNNNGGKWPTKFDVTTAWGKFNEDGEDEVKEILQGKGWEFIRLRTIDKVELWRRPGKDKGVSATFHKFHNMFYNFSSSAEYFESEKGYTYFDVLLMVKFGNDKVNTIKYLEKKYSIVHYKPKVTKKTINFPIDIFPEYIKTYIMQQNKQSNHDINLLCSVELWLFSTLIGNKFSTLVHDSWNVSPVMWLMIVADRGSSKTHAINAIIKPLKNIDSKYRKQFENELKEYDLEGKQPRPVWRQVLLEDGTREGFIKAMNINYGGMGLMKDELDGWLSDMDKHSATKGGDESFWLSSYNNSSYSKNIKGDDGTHASKVFISLAGSIQPGVLDTIMQKHVVNGLFDRFLLIPYKDTNFKFSLKKPEISYHKWYFDFIEYAYSKFNMYEDIEMVISIDAVETFEKCYNKFLAIKHEAESPKLSAYMAKIITMLPRIALIIELTNQVYAHSLTNDGTDFTTSITKNSILKSFDVLNYFINNAKNLLFDVDEKTDMINIIKASGSIKRGDKVTALLEAMERKEINCSKVDVGIFIGMSKQQVNFYHNKVNRSKQK